MFEESVCLLLRASWYKPLIVEEREETYDDPEDDQYYPYDPYEDDNEEFEDAYLGVSPSLRIGNRRWGDNGYVRAGRQEARPVLRSEFAGPSSSREPVTKHASKDKTGRRAKRALKREAADKAAAAKHQEHLARFGRK